MSVRIAESEKPASAASLSAITSSQPSVQTTSSQPEGLGLQNSLYTVKSSSANAIDAGSKINYSTPPSPKLKTPTSSPTFGQSLEQIESLPACVPKEQNQKAELVLVAEQKSSGPILTGLNDSGDIAEAGSPTEPTRLLGTSCSDGVVGNEKHPANVTSELAPDECQPSAPMIAHPLAPQVASSTAPAVSKPAAVPDFAGHVTSRIGKRYHATPDQLAALTVAFEANPSPSADILLQLSKKTLMPLQNLVLWFKNRRARSTRTPVPASSVETSQSGRRSYVKSGIYSKKPKSIGQSNVNPESEHFCSASVSTAAQTTGAMTACLTTLASDTTTVVEAPDVNENVDISAERLEIGGSPGGATTVRPSAEDISNGQSHHHHDDHSHVDEHHHTLHLHDHSDHTHHLHPHIPPHQHQDDHDHLDHEDDASGQVDGGSAIVEADVLDSCGLPTSMPASVFRATEDESTNPVVDPDGVHSIIGNTRRIDAQESQGPTETCKRPRVENIEVIGDANPCAAWDSETCHARFATFLSMSTGGRSNEQVDCALAIASKFFFDEMQNGLTLTSAVQILPHSRYVLEQLMDSTLCKSGAKLNSGLRTILQLFLAEIRSGRASNSCATFGS
jgi:hypothetical protein